MSGSIRVKNVDSGATGLRVIFGSFFCSSGYTLVVRGLSFSRCAAFFPSARFRLVAFKGFVFGTITLRFWCATG